MPGGSSAVCGCRRYRPAPSGRRLSSGCSTRAAALEPPAFGIRQEMVCFHAARRGHKPSSAERGASQVERSVLRLIYPKKQITQPVAGGIRRREFGWLKCQRLSRPCLQGGKMTKHERTKNGAESSRPCF